uniref:Uncharacterized protein n=1 Tax=Octopus bimaculoides TaxID=37653 RepID=A0A0L8HGW0_OCTBM
MEPYFMVQDKKALLFEPFFQLMNQSSELMVADARCSLFLTKLFWEAVCSFVKPTLLLPLLFSSLIFITCFHCSTL